MTKEWMKGNTLLLNFNKKKQNNENIVKNTNGTSRPRNVYLNLLSSEVSKNHCLIRVSLNEMNTLQIKELLLFVDCGFINSLR